MKSRKGKNQVFLLFILIAVVAVIAVYRIGFHSPVPGFDEEKLKSIQNNDSQQEKPSATVSSLESEFQASPSNDLKQIPPKQPTKDLRSPKYFRVVFGKDATGSMLGVIKESAGTGDGYNVAYMDENMNGDLTDEVEKRFPQYKSGSRAGQLDPRFEFQGPFKTGVKAKYTLYLYSINHQFSSRIPENDCTLLWFLDAGQWHYFFINGRMSFYSSADDALKGKPVHLASQCQWDISTRIRSGNAVVSAGLKDKNGCTLRSVSRAGDRLSPTLTLTKDEKVVMEEKMKFG
jgi:hypothetical protein